jgi:hypothetical protein
MLIPNKHSGYQMGIRLYPGGGGGQMGTSTPAAASAPSNPYDKLGVNTQVGYNTLMQTQAPGTTGQQKGNLYNNMLGQGFNDNQIRSSADTLFGKQSDTDWSQLAQYAGQQSPTGRPMPGSAQFFQPVYQQQDQNYNTGNAMGVSQYGTQNNFNPQTQSMFGGQMQGGGYGQYGTNNPFSAYSNSYLNLDPNLNQGTQANKVNAYRDATGRGFGDQQIYNQATGLFGQQSPQDWNYLKNQAGYGGGGGLNNYQPGGRGGGASFNQTMGELGLFSGMGGGGGMPQMQNPYSYQSQQSYQPQNQFNGGDVGIGNFMQRQFESSPQVAPPQRTSSGPSQAIVGRSSQMRGTPNVMRRAEGGIASLMGDFE